MLNYVLVDESPLWPRVAFSRLLSYLTYKSESWCEFWAKPEYHDSGSWSNFMLNMDITSLTRGLYLGPSMCLEYCLFLNTACFKFRHTVSAASAPFSTILPSRILPSWMAWQGTSTRRFIAFWNTRGIYASES